MTGKIKRRNLRVYERDHIYPQSISYYIKLFSLSPLSHKYLANYWEVVAYRNDYFWWARDADLLEQAFRKWFKKWLIDRKEREDLFHRYKTDAEKARKLTSRLKQVDVRRASNRELAQFYQKTVKLAFSHVLYAEYTTDLFDDFFGKIFIESLRKYAEIDPSDIADFLRPSSVSASAEFRKKLLILSLASRPAKKQIINVANQYNWIQMSWDGSNELTTKRIIKELRELKKTGITERKKEIREISGYSKKMRQGRIRLLKRYGIKKEKFAIYFQLLDRFNILHNYRKEIQMRSNQVIYRILKEIPKRFALPIYDIMFYMPEEIERLLQNGQMVSGKLIKQRQAGLTWFVKRGKVTEYLGEKASQKLEELVISVVRAKKESEIKGMSASRGVARGRAFVTRSSKEASRKLKQGDILIVSMTTVDYLPAMRRAGAVVTDDGGTTCHAAVVSRELGIPCVVGTKIATQILKTGDKVFVDATKGIVKKL